MTKIDMLVALPSRKTAPRVTVTAMPPLMTGRAAATSVPKTSISASRATGMA